METKLINIPKAIYKHCKATNTHSFSYPILRGFSLTANSLEALIELQDQFFSPIDTFKTVSEYNKAVLSSLDDTAIIELDKIA